MDVHDDENVKDALSSFEAQFSKQLLIEALNEQKAEVFENIVFDGKKRYYIENLCERDYYLESTTPYQIQIDNNVIEEKTWSGLICKVSKLLIEKYPEYFSSMKNFRCQWSKQVMYDEIQKTNYKHVVNNLYVNCNHTALHSCWFIQDLLDYFNIDKVKVRFLIHRPSGTEPKNVKEHIEKRSKRRFKFFLIDKYKKTEEYANKVINNIDKHLNKLLSKTSKSYDNFFLFDDKLILYNYIVKVKQLIEQNIRYNENEKLILNKYLDYIYAYYKS